MIDIVEFLTPDDVLLKGLTLGSKDSKHWYIFIHGLGGNMLSMYPLNKNLSKNSTVFTFNNRGHDLISRIKKVDKRKKSGYASFYGGAAHEIFTDCIHDIQGSIEYAKANGATSITLIGHSTGCQKIVYYLSKNTHQKLVKNVILLSPLSDFAGSINRIGLSNYEQLLKISLSLVTANSPYTLLPDSLITEPIDAQRFISLYTPMSDEEIFSYVDPTRKSIISKITLPLYVIFGNNDEFADRPIHEIKEWFDTHNQSHMYMCKLIDTADHGFTDTEDEVGKIIKSWISD